MSDQTESSDTLPIVSKEYGSCENEDDCKQLLTVEEAVEQCGLGWFQIRLLLTCGLLFVADAMEMLLLAVLGPVLRCEWTLQGWEVAMITTVVFTGMLVSGVTTGIISDMFGRRPTLLALVWWITLFGMLTAASTNVIWLYIFRFLVGFGLAGSFTSYTIVAEYLPNKYRGRVASSIIWSWSVGAIVQSLLSMWLEPQYGWRVLVVVSTFPILICSILFSVYLPESVRFLMVAGRKKDAEKFLNEAAKVNGKEIKGTLKDAIEADRGRICDLFGKEYCFSSLLVYLLWFCISFLYYGSILVSAEIGKHHDVCVNTGMPVSSHNRTVPIFRCCEGCPALSHSEYVTMVVAAIGDFFGPLIVILLVDVLGRKKMLSLLGAVSALFYGLLQVCGGTFWVQFLTAGVRCTSLGSFAAIYIYTTELYPTSVRALGFGIGNSTARLGAMLTPFITQVIGSTHFQAALFIYMGMGLAVMILPWILPVETHGREMKQVIDNGEKNDSEKNEAENIDR